MVRVELMARQVAAAPRSAAPRLLPLRPDRRLRRRRVVWLAQQRRLLFLAFPRLREWADSQAIGSGPGY